MPETYGALGATIPVKTDKPIAIPSAFKAFVDSIGTGQGKGKLLVVQNTGAAAWTAMKGDATLAEDGTLALANSGHFLNLGEITASAAGSFSTPIKVTLPRVSEGQRLEFHFIAAMKSSVAVAKGANPKLALSVNGKSSGAQSIAQFAESGANAWRMIESNGPPNRYGTNEESASHPGSSPFMSFGNGEGAEGERSPVGFVGSGKGSIPSWGTAPFFAVCPGEWAGTAIQVEVKLASITSGSITAKNVWMYASISG